MEILITGALPPKRIAEALIKEIPQDSAFIKRLQQHKATLHQLDSELIGCTPAEYYRVQQQEFSPTAGQRYVDAIPALDYQNKKIEDNHGIYTLALCNIHIDFQSTRLFPSHELQITKEQSLALFEAVKYLFADKKIKLIAINVDHWVISLPQSLVHNISSPNLLSYQALHDYWPKEESNQALRQLLNEVQMLWHEHPVNQTRKEQGLREINSPWIYGGAHPKQIEAQPSYPYAIISTLEQAYRNEDWGRWLDLLPQLEKDIKTIQSPQYHQARAEAAARANNPFNSLKPGQEESEPHPDIFYRGQNQAQNTKKEPSFLLAGYDQLIKLEPLSFWQRTVNNFKNSTDWKSWWHQS
ncbi:MAG: hypothetical protein Q4G44_05210 [Alcaligenaceae bacterium]|nr:hypothetical protein [Alcaligenaceae bacterium]